MATVSEQIQQIYIGLLGRAADQAGLDYWAAEINSGALTLEQLRANIVNEQPEYAAGQGSMTRAQAVADLYENLFNRQPEAAGLEYWVNGGGASVNIDQLVLALIAGASAADQLVLDNKTEVAEYYTAAAGADYTADAAKAAVDNVDATRGSVDAAKVAIDSGTVASGQTFTLTVGVDTVVGTAANDTITGTYDPINKLHTLSGLDNIDGGAGTDTLTVTDAAGGNIDFTGVTIKNVEVLNVQAAGALVSATPDLTKIAPGLTSATIDVAQGAGLTVTAATTTALNVTNDNAVTIVGGGGAVEVNSINTANVTIGNVAGGAANANKITSATVNGASKADVTDNSGAAGAVGATLTTVTLEDIAGAATLTGDAINTVSLTDAATTASLDVVNAKAHTLGLTVNTVAASVVVTDATATAVNITTTGLVADTEGSDIELDVVKAATITVTGAGDLVLTDSGTADYSALTTFNYTGSGSVEADLTGAALLTKVVAGTATGAVDVTVGGAVTSVTTGSGDDTVTIDGAATSDFEGTLSLGDGSDTVAVANGGVITADATVDAGDGVDNLALAIVGVANVGAFKNFENFDVATLAANFDQDVLNANNDVENFIGTASVGGNITLDNLGAGVGFIVKGDMGAGQNVVLTQATAGALTITSDVDSDEGAGAVVTDGELFEASNATSINAVFDNDNVDDAASTAQLDIEGTAATKLSIVSGGSNVTNILNFTGGPGATLDLLTSVTITGDQALEFDYATGGKTLALASVDASGQTDGGLTFSLDDLTATGTVKLGGGDDVISFDTAITTTTATSSSVVTINGLEKGAEAGLGAQDGFDVLVFANAAQAGDVVVGDAAGFVSTDGLVTFTGAGPATLAAAIALFDAELSINEAVVFNFAGTNYIYGAGAAVGDTTDDLLVKLTGVTDITGLDVAGAGNIYLF
ncbi:MAG: hypothetical protein PWP11_1267 [Thauera sp.]|nr:DUF4214 domain-containing protein [Thauera sp.]MDI3489990.1 hypothetical protein [Thauera sp.]